MARTLVLQGVGDGRAAGVIAAMVAHGLAIDQIVLEDASLPLSVRRVVQRAASVVIVLADDVALGPAMLDAARLAHSRQALAIANLSEADLPTELTLVPVFNLGRWRGRGDNPTLLALVSYLRGQLAANASATKKRGFQKWLVGGSIGGVATFAFSFVGADLFNLQQQVCSFPEPKPWAWLSDTCGSVGLGDRPTRTERLAWEAREPESCDALVSHIRQFPQGKLVPQAHALYAARSTVETGRRILSTQSLPLFVEVAPQGGDRADALARGQKKAVRYCEMYAVDQSITAVSAHAAPETWRCSDTGCSFEGVAICELETKEVVEKCPSAA